MFITTFNSEKHFKYRLEAVNQEDVQCLLLIKNQNKICAYTEIMGQITSVEIFIPKKCEVQ